jgi:hypothetical protein
MSSSSKADDKQLSSYCVDSEQTGVSRNASGSLRQVLRGIHARVVYPALPLRGEYDERDD